MDRYEFKSLINSKIPKTINKKIMEIILRDFRDKFLKANDYAKYEDLTINFCILILICEIYQKDETLKKYCDNILDKINPSYLWYLFISVTCDRLLENKMDILDKFLKSFIGYGLIKDANVIEVAERKFIELTLNNGEKMRYSHIYLPKKSIDKFRNNCHAVVSGFIKVDSNWKVAVVIEKNALFKGIYHSFLIRDNIVYDLSHNIMMKYDDYVKYINPKVLVLEDAKVVLDGIENLKKYKAFSKSNYVDILKYAMTSSIKKKQLKYSYYQKQKGCN